MSTGNNFFDFQERLSATRQAARPPVAPTKTTTPIEPLTVSKLTHQIDRVIKTGMPNTVHVKGEVSNLKMHGSSGHTYFTLKDPDACIDCVMWKSDAARLKFKPADGMELIARGFVGVYGARGRYQLYTN